jgi:hypothetical protein
VRNLERSWDVGLSGGRPLDLDLGTTCLITHFSTQGRHPHTRLYPRVLVEKAGQPAGLGKGAILVEDQPDHPPNEQYAGPTWTVLQSGADADSRRGVFPPPLAWVARYELLWRADGGRAWNSLGEFRGNVDPTTEVAHYFGDVQGGGLHARYLRVRPVECEGKGAMRLGVYGTPLRGTGDVEVAGQTGTRVVNDDATPQFVTYFLTQRRPSCNRRFSRRNPMYQGGPRRWDREGELRNGRTCYSREEVLAEVEGMQEAAVKETDVLAHKEWLDENECAGICDGYNMELPCSFTLACALEESNPGGGDEAGTGGARPQSGCRLQPGRFPGGRGGVVHNLEVSVDVYCVIRPHMAHQGLTPRQGCREGEVDVSVRGRRRFPHGLSIVVACGTLPLYHCYATTTRSACSLLRRSAYCMPPPLLNI